MTDYHRPTKANGWLVSPVEMALERQARRSVDPRKYEKWTPRSQVRKSAIDDRLDVTLPALSFLERR